MKKELGVGSLGNSVKSLSEFVSFVSISLGIEEK